MISFTRKDNRVVIHVEHGIFMDEERFNLELVQGENYQAELLRKAFQDNLNRHLSELKEKYYNMGWKDAKAKKRGKLTSFLGGWNW